MSFPLLRSVRCCTSARSSLYCTKASCLRNVSWLSTFSWSRALLNRREPTRTILWGTDSKSTLDALGTTPWTSSDHVQELWTVMLQLWDHGHKVIVVWVPGHCGLLENEMADTLATEVASKPFLRHTFATIPR